LPSSPSTTPASGPSGCRRGRWVAGGGGWGWGGQGGGGLRWSCRCRWCGCVGGGWVTREGGLQGCTGRCQAAPRRAAVRRVAACTHRHPSSYAWAHPSSNSAAPPLLGTRRAGRPAPSSAAPPPRRRPQVMVVPISEGAYSYCHEVRAALRKAQLHCDVDISDRKMQKKVRGGPRAFWGGRGEGGLLLLPGALTLPALRLCLGRVCVRLHVGCARCPRHPPQFPSQQPRLRARRALSCPGGVEDYAVCRSWSWGCWGYCCAALCHGRSWAARCTTQGAARPGGGGGGGTLELGAAAGGSIAVGAAAPGLAGRWLPCACAALWRRCTMARRRPCVPAATAARPPPAPPPQVREAQLAQYNYILVVGESERHSGTVNVRTRDNHVHGAFKWVCWPGPGACCPGGARGGAGTAASCPPHALGPAAAMGPGGLALARAAAPAGPCSIAGGVVPAAGRLPRVQSRALALASPWAHLARAGQRHTAPRSARRQPLVQAPSAAPSS
jgi:hypothetical protein